MYSVKQLENIVEQCRSEGKLAREQLLFLEKSIEDFLERRAPSLDHAFGLSMPAGGVPWWKERAIRERNAALVELAAVLGKGQSVSATAELIHRVALRYAATAWRFDREHEEPPPAYAGTSKELLWKAFASGAPMPLSVRQLRNIISQS